MESIVKSALMAMLSIPQIQDTMLTVTALVMETTGGVHQTPNHHACKPETMTSAIAMLATIGMASYHPQTVITTANVRKNK